jgi:hypothetical protein
VTEFTYNMMCYAQSSGIRILCFWIHVDSKVDRTRMTQFIHFFNPFPFLCGKLKEVKRGRGRSGLKSSFLSLSLSTNKKRKKEKKI